MTFPPKNIIPFSFYYKYVLEISAGQFGDKKRGRTYYKFSPEEVAKIRGAFRAIADIALEAYEDTARFLPEPETEYPEKDKYELIEQEMYNFLIEYQDFKKNNK